MSDILNQYGDSLVFQLYMKAATLQNDKNDKNDKNDAEFYRHLKSR